ncbi:MAG: hypothetical protein ACOH2M_16950 [Cypionkella sp.]
MLGQLFRFRRGVLFIGGRRLLRAAARAEYSILIGLVGIVLHPTFASLAGSRWSALWVLVCLALQLPALTRIVVAPFVSIVLACGMCVLVTKSPSSILFCIPSYALFFMLTYRTARFYATYLALTGVAIFVALLQFLFTWDFLNVYATAQSIGGFLNQYRPTSIFPSQAYYNQMLLALIPVFWIAKERRPWVWLIVGIAAAITGSTAGVVLAVLAVLLFDFKGYFALLGFAATNLVMAVLYPERLAYNFSLDDFFLSLGSRLSATGGTLSGNLSGTALVPAGDVPVTSLPGYPTLMIAFQVLALVGLILIPMIAARERIGLVKLIPPGLGLAAIVAAQMIHPIIGSLYFSIFLAVLVALAWRFQGMALQRPGSPARRASALAQV